MPVCLVLEFLVLEVICNSEIIIMLSQYITPIQVAFFQRSSLSACVV